MNRCRRGTTLALGLLAAAVAPAAAAQQIQDIGGIQYRIDRQEIPVQIPVTETREQQQTTYRQQVTTETVQHQQLYSVPVTQYQVVSQLHGRWNPFMTPYWTHHYAPVTTWQQQVATVQIPVTRVAWAPETRTVQQPVTTWKTANRIVLTHTPIGASPTTALAAKPLSGSPSATIAAVPNGSTSTSTSVASRPLGGEALTSDPPRQPTGWQPSGTSRY
jgi:hypothetical protein